MMQLVRFPVFAAILAVAPVGAAHAAPTFTYVSNVSGNFTNTAPILTDRRGRAVAGSFSDTFQFLTTKSLLASFTLTSNGGPATTSPTYLKFSTVTIDGTDIPITITSGRTTETRTGSLFDFRLPAGLQTLLISGDTGTSGSYTGSFSLVAVPEASTWAMMIGGFGMVGAGMRRKRRVIAKVAFA